jgi:hypothetical protein
MMQLKEIEGAPVKRKKRKALRNLDTRWPNGVLPYKIAKDFSKY